MAANGVASPDVDVTYILEAYKNAGAAGLEYDPCYDVKVLDKMKEVCGELLIDFGGLQRTRSPVVPSGIQSAIQKIKNDENAIEITKTFFNALNAQTEGQHKYDILTLGGALYMSLKCIQEYSYIYSPAEFLAQALYIMCFRNREDDPKTYKAIESCCIMNRYIRELLWNLHRVADSVPEALEARFYFETPFDVDIDHLQALCEDAQVTPTLDASKFMSTRLKAQSAVCGTSGGSKAKPCAGSAEQMEKLMNVVGPIVDAAQRAAGLERKGRQSVQ